jgi:hypothetical protein
MSINIEEERVAFEELSYPNAATVDFDGKTYKPRFNSEWQRVVSEHANRMFLVWIQAKEHAIEMAKPTFKPEPYNGGWGVQDITHKYWLTLPSKDRAIEFAIDQGYRVLNDE